MQSSATKTTILGYEVLDMLARGSRSSVYRARRPGDPATVILKLLPLEHPSPALVARFRKEYEITQGVPARGASRAFALEEFEGSLCMVLRDFGGTRLSLLLDGQRLDLNVALRLSVQIAERLAEIHDSGVIHKDVNPANVVCDFKSGTTELIDFGVSTDFLQETTSAKGASLLEGTLPYISPEQTGRMNRPVDKRTDFYSLGATLYQLFTGRLPFDLRDPAELIHAHLARRPVPPHDVDPRVPEVLSAIVMKLLEKAPEARYKSASGARTDLATCLSQLEKEGRIDAFPLGREDTSERLEIPQKLYGRDAEIRVLLDAFDRVREGGTEIVLVAGYSGVGKSSVVRALSEPVSQSQSSFIAGKFEQYKRDIPYATFVQALRELVTQFVATSDAELTQLRAEIADALGPNGQVLIDLLPEADLLLGPQKPVPELPFAEAQNRFQMVLRQFVGVFARRECPLVIFLDDLQWVDPATLKLIQHIATSPELGHVLLLGAYRDNEVGSTHPLVLTMEELKRQGAQISEMTLRPLEAEHVQSLLADTLLVQPADVASLATLAHHKTGGNPFFLTQFLTALHRDGLLRFDLNRRAFSWEIDQIRERGFADNVIDLMIGKLQQLHPRTRNGMRLAACAGNQIDFRTLALISHVTEDEAKAGIREAVSEGLVLTDGETLRFLHDRVQQAAYSLIPEAERGEVHLQIGRLLLAHTKPEALGEQIFEIVSQLNLGAAGIVERAERDQLAELNLQAGRKAKASAAWQSAARFFAAAIEMLGEEGWEKRYPIAFETAFSRAECEFLSNDLDTAEKLFDALLERAKRPIDKAAIYRVCVDLFTTRVDLHRAIDSGIQGLRLLGVDIPAKPSQEEVQVAYDTVWKSLGERRIEELMDLPWMTEPDIRAAMDILGQLFAPALGFDRNLLILCYCRMVDLSIVYGNCEASAIAYAYFGTVIGPAFGRYREGYDFGKLGSDFADRHGIAAYKAKIELIFGNCTLYFSQHAEKCVEHLQNGFAVALETGDITFACYCCNHIVVDLVVLGHPLAEVYEESVRRLAFTTRAKFDAPSWVIRVMQRFILNMRGLTTHFSTYDDGEFDQEKTEAFLDTYAWKFPTGVYYIYKMAARLLSGDYEEALQAGDKAEPELWASFSMIQLPEWWFYYALSVAAVFDDAPAEKKEGYRQKLAAHLDQLGTWATHCPDNYEHKRALVAAEIARLEGRALDAMAQYDAAIESARANGYVHHEGLAYELASAFYQRRGFKTIALDYLRHARHCFARWGATGKVQALDQKHPGLRLSATEDRVQRNPDATIFSTSNLDVLDASTVFKASMAISSELVLDRLLARLIEIIIENAGAQRGYLFLSHDEALTFDARGDAETREFARVASVPLDKAGHDIPKAIVQSVARTKKSLVLDDATREGPFRSDSYVLSARPLAVLCAPILQQGKLTGVLYLENNLAAGAFTAERVSTVVALASQTAVSVDNALLYERLEERVEERTRELRQAQQKLVESARRAGMAEIATNILHNVGNVLTSVNMSLTVAGERVRDLSAAQLGKVVTLLKENEADLGTFFTKDSRGSVLPQYLDALATKTTSQRDAAMREIDAMRKHIDHIQRIVAIQQSYAGPSKLIETLDPTEIIESALLINFPSKESSAIQVRREFEEIGLVPTDRHKVQQILVNLVSNAKFAMNAISAEQVLTLRLSRRQPKSFSIDVSDNGIGIATEDMTRIFQHGFTTRPDGHGFGLHASAIAAKEMDGQLIAHSDGLGKGATFTLTLPLPS